MQTYIKTTDKQTFSYTIYTEVSKLSCAAQIVPLASANSLSTQQERKYGAIRIVGAMNRERSDVQSTIKESYISYQAVTNDILDLTVLF